MFRANSKSTKILQAYHMVRHLGFSLALVFVFISHVYDVKAEPLFVLKPPKDPVQALKPFTTDGCSLFPDGTLEHASLWRACCVAHDLAYWKGGNYSARLAADQALLNCVEKQGEPMVALAMLLGVRVGGSPFWPTPFRWGYGWAKWRGYQALSPQDVKRVEQALISLPYVQPANDH